MSDNISNLILSQYLGFDGDHGNEEHKEREPPKRGHTIYIHGHSITEEMIRRTFSNFGKIVNINMEKDKKLVLFCNLTVIILPSYYLCLWSSGLLCARVSFLKYLS